MADLAFPSLGLYLEIDEGQHGDKDHKIADIKRDAEILEATDWECKRIAVFLKKGNTKIDKKLSELNNEIDSSLTSIFIVAGTSKIVSSNAFSFTIVCRPPISE